MKLVQLHCKKDMIIYGRNKDGSPDKCFAANKEYVFCVDIKRKKKKFFTVNDVKEVHFLGEDKFTDEHFDLIKEGEITEFNLDEVTLKRYRKLFKERYDYIE